MKRHYIRLLTDVDLNDEQQHIWYGIVERFIDNPAPENFIDQFNAQREELEGDEEFPYVFVVYLPASAEPKKVENIVNVWGKIYPRDFEIETSADYDCEDGSCEVEIDDAMHEEIIGRANKFLHNRWVEDQLHEGWRYGLKLNRAQRVDPKLRDWDSLNEQYRPRLELTREQATKFFKKYPHIFT